MAKVKKSAVSLCLSGSLFERINCYLQRPVTVAKSRNDLLEKAAIEFLDREEEIAEKIEKEVLRIRNDYQ